MDEANLDINTSHTDHSVLDTQNGGAFDSNLIDDDFLLALQQHPDKLRIEAADRHPDYHNSESDEASDTGDELDEE